MTPTPSTAAIVATSLFGQLIDALGRLMAFFYSLIPNYGVAIILLTIAVRLLLFPLTAKQVRSMKRMSQLQPEIKRLQAKYRDDRQKMNEELLKFYKENQINPAAGCLPLLLQMPVFFALFRVLRHPLDHIPVSSDLFGAFCGTLDKAACKATAGFPKGLKFMWMDLSVQAREGPPKVAGGHGFTSFGQALPYFVLIVLVVLTGMYQGKMMQARQPQDNPSPQAAQMQMVARILPIFMGFISIGLPAGIVLYFLVGNLWQIGQQAIIANRDVKLPAIKFVDRDDDVVVEVEDGASSAGAKATLVADDGADGDGTTAAPAKPTPASQRPGAARKPAAGGGGGPRPARTNPSPPKPQPAKAQPAKAQRAKAQPAPAAADEVDDGDEAMTDAATATAAPRPMFPWRKAPAAEPSGAANGGGAPSRLFGGRGAPKEAPPAKGAATRGAGKGGTTAKGGTPAKGAASGSTGANRSGTPASGRVTPKGGAANRSKKRR
jgi:YidC/Oxa1 family membrane protein insertase